MKDNRPCSRSRAGSPTREIGMHFDVAILGGRQHPLQGGNGHYAVVGVLEAPPGLFGLRLARILEQDAGDDLKAVGDPVPDFLQQNVVLATLRLSPPQRLAHRSRR